VREISRLEVELGQQALHWYALAAALPEPGLAVLEAAPVLLGHGFIVGWGRDYSAGNGIEEHELQKADGGIDLEGLKPFDEFMSVLSVRGCFHYLLL
jgi:hypothetical protein